ncbi:MAG: 16S rRNA (guanine(966)-N(2))-methyltransferase RsmD [Solirubrobacterales bacterium]
MRVVAGELKGRRLTSPPRGRGIRPTSDRVREALFSILGERVAGMSVLDLFAGTGALAIEALSRGATRATLVDDDLAAARRNVEGLGLGERCRLVRSDVEDYLEREKGAFGVIFCDPPYTLADRLQAPLDKLLPSRLSAAGVVVVESATRNPLSLGLELHSQRSYGDTHIAIYGGGDG